MSVSMKPGATAFTVMPRDAYSWAKVFVNPMMPAFEANRRLPGLPVSPTTLDRLMRPVLARIIVRIAALAQYSGPARLVAKVRSISFA